MMMIIIIILCQFCEIGDKIVEFDWLYDDDHISLRFLENKGRNF